MKQKRQTHHEESFSLALAGTAIGTTILAALLGATLPLAATLAIGAIAAWIGEHLDRHLISPVQTWRALGLAGTVGGAAGFLVRHALAPSRLDGQDAIAGLVIIAICAWLAATCRRPRDT